MVKIQEIHEGETENTISSESERRNYIIRECKEKNDAYAAFFSYIANGYPTIGNKSLSSLLVREDRKDSPVVFYGEAAWTKNANDGGSESDDLPRYRFSTKGGTAHIKFGTNIGRYTKDNASVIPFQGIGPSPGGTNGNYEGCDIVVPAWSASVTVTLNNSVAGNWSFHQMIRGMTGCMNSSTYMGCSSGELLYLGADITSRYKMGDRGTYRVWDVQHDFIGSSNASGLLIEGISVAEKYGFDYMSVFYVQGEVETGEGENKKKQVIQMARQINVDRVYTPVDFSALGLPVSSFGQ